MVATLVKKKGGSIPRIGQPGRFHERLCKAPPIFYTAYFLLRNTRRTAGSAGRTMTMIADPTTEAFMIGDDGEMLGSAWCIDDRDQQRTHIGYIA